MKLTVALFLLAASATAHGHATANPRTAIFGSYFTTAIRIPHGCAGSSTTKVAVKIGEDISHVKARRVPGWTLDIVYRDNDNATTAKLGENRTVDVLTWTALTESDYLPDNMFEDFGVNIKLPQSSSKTAVYLPTTQTCVNGTSAWVGIPDAEGALATGVLPSPQITLSENPKTGSTNTTALKASGATKSSTLLGVSALVPSLLAIAAANVV